MNTLDWILLAVAALLVLVVFVGSRIARRRTEARDAGLRATLAAANDALARAHADDNGWDRGTMEAAARAAFAGQVDELRLVQVIDRPGTEADEAVFQVVSAGTASEVRLGRVDGDWVAR